MLVGKASSLRVLQVGSILMQIRAHADLRAAGTGKSVLLREIIKQLSAIEVEDDAGKKRKRKVGQSIRSDG